MFTLIKYGAEELGNRGCVILMHFWKLLVLNYVTVERFKMHYNSQNELLCEISTLARMSSFVKPEGV